MQKQSCLEVLFFLALLSGPKMGHGIVMAQSIFMFFFFICWTNQHFKFGLVFSTDADQIENGNLTLYDDTRINALIQ